jgi:hypothetical protein
MRKPINHENIINEYFQQSLQYNSNSLNNEESHYVNVLIHLNNSNINPTIKN